MQEIKCPHCGKVFQVDETGYSQIVQQVRDIEFEKELKRREQELAQKKEKDFAFSQMLQEKQHTEELSKKTLEIADKDREIECLKAQLDKADTEKKLAVSEAVQEKTKELSEKNTEKGQHRSYKGFFITARRKGRFHLSFKPQGHCTGLRVSGLHIAPVGQEISRDRDWQQPAYTSVDRDSGAP